MNWCKYHLICYHKNCTILVKSSTGRHLGWEMGNCNNAKWPLEHTQISLWPPVQVNVSQWSSSAITSNAVAKSFILKRVATILEQPLHITYSSTTPLLTLTSIINTWNYHLSESFNLKKMRNSNYTTAMNFTSTTLDFTAEPLYWSAWNCTGAHDVMPNQWK